MNGNSIEGAETLGEHPLGRKSISIDAKPGSQRSGTIGFIALMALLVSLEIFSALLSYHTDGEVFSLVLMGATGLNILAILLYILKYRIVAIVLATIIGLGIVPRQLADGYELLLLQQESARIVAHLYEMKIAAGSYPENLAGYSFQHPELRSSIKYVRNAEEGFALYYNVGSGTSDYWYRPGTGWGYYPD